MDLFTLIGLAGVAGYVASYALLQLGMLDGNGLPYSVANVAAASLVLISLTSDFNLASAVIQVVWIVVGVVGLVLRMVRRRAVAAGQNTFDDRSFADSTRLPRVDTRPAFQQQQQQPLAPRLRLVESAS